MLAQTDILDRVAGNAALIVLAFFTVLPLLIVVCHFSAMRRIQRTLNEISDTLRFPPRPRQ